MHASIAPTGWSHRLRKPFEYIYGLSPRNPVMRRRGRFEPIGDRVGYCVANASTPKRDLALTTCDSMCPDDRRGRFCERRKDSFCMRQCSYHGHCDAGFCWCDEGWFGVDCSQHLRRSTPRKQDEQLLPGPTAVAAPALGLRIYVYDMPSEFTTRNLQYRSDELGPHREVNRYSAHQFSAGSLYALETAWHEWLLDSPLRTLAGADAHLYYVPIYLASLFLWPVAGYADEPYYGRAGNASKKRGHQGTLLMLRALGYIRRRFPFWNASGGRDHVWMMLHDEG